MPPITRKPVFALSILIAVLAALSSVGGLLLEGLYRDNDFVRSTWLGNDLVTLFLAVPVLIAAMFFARRSSQGAYLIWLGMLYNYAFYLFAAAFNAFFLLYVSLLALSIFALVFGLVSLDVQKIAQQFSRRTPVRWIAGYMLFVAMGLSAVYLAQSIGFVFTGSLPSIVGLTGHPTNVVIALDLTLLIPVMVLGAMWIWQRKPWGYILAGISLVKGRAYTLVLSINSLWATKTVMADASAQAPLWVTLTVLGLIAAVLLFWNMNPHQNFKGIH